jgi:hypothetical protein
MSQCGCFSFGTTRLYEDQLGYSRALGDAEKSETLLLGDQRRQPSLLSIQRRI